VGIEMTISYKKLWKLLIDKEITKHELCQQTGLSPATLHKFNSGKSVTGTTLMRICKYLECDVGDIMEYIRTEGENNAN
jgi:DNA-binding Xre family transcriptional regulator